MIVTRTFHPVGQGAFYSEVFRMDDKVCFVTVYDCGSETAPKGKTVSALGQQILEFKNRLGPNPKIDILFISHFHADHVNGLSNLLSGVEVKKTVVPMLNNETILVARAYNHLNFDTKTAEECDSIMQELYSGLPESPRFGEIIFVKPMSPEAARDSNEGGKLISNGREIDSGDSINNDPFWEYVPFNSFELSDTRAIKFRHDLDVLCYTKYGDTRHDLSAVILEHRDDVHKLYKGAIGHANENIYCLLLVSRPVAGVVPKTLSRESHGLYLGDFDYHQKSNPWDRLTCKIDYKTMGTVQVPHHGAKANWDSGKMLDGQQRDYIVSSGSTNRYHHPSFWVVEDIRNAGLKVYVVSEEARTEKVYDIEI